MQLPVMAESVYCSLVKKGCRKRWYINIDKYGAHSTRAAFTSAAKAANVSVKTIIDAAGWANAGTFPSSMISQPRLVNQSVLVLIH